MITRLMHQGKLLALILGRAHRGEGIEFFTPDDFSQQLAYMNRPAGYVIAPHVHNAVERQVQYTKEVLFIRSGRLRIDFNQAETSAACANDGRIAAAGVGSLSLVANDKDVNWCIQPLIGQTQRPAQDFTGHWYSPSDSGWGVGIATAQAADKVVLLAVLYYPDATGAPRWAYAQSNDFRSGQSIEIFQRNAYCRTCAPVAPNDISAGRMTINLANVEGLAGQPNNITFNVDFKGPAGGAFARTSSPLIRLVERPREIQ